MLNLSFYITIILLSLNQFTSVYKSGESNIYLFDLSVFLFSLCGLIYFLLIKRSFKLPKFSLLFLIFSLVALVSLLAALPNFSTDQLTISFFYLLRFISYLLGSIVLFNMVEKKLITKDRVVNTFILSGVLISIIGFIQLLVLPDFTVLSSSLGWDPHKNRLASSFFDPNFVGAYIVLCLILLFDRIYSKKDKKRLKGIEKLDLLYLIILITTLFLTFSRSAWGMFAVVIVIYGLFRSKFLLITAFLIAFMAYFATPRIQTRISGITDPADSASLRMISWVNTIEIIKDNVILGVGFNTFRYVQKEYGFLTPETLDTHSGSGSDSSILFVWATTGLLGLIIYLTAFFFPVYESVVKRYSGKLMILSVVFGLFLESFFINSLFYPQILFLFLSILFIL